MREISIRKRIRNTVLFCVLLSLMMTVKPKAAAVVNKNIKMRVGQKVTLKLKGVETPLTWTVISGKKKVKLRNNGVLKAKRTGKAVVQVVYHGVTYRFKAKIRAKKKGQKKVRTIEQYIPPEKVTEDKMILIGDSRFQGMRSVVGGKATWICAEGEGVYWLKNTVVPMLKKRKVKGCAIVFNLGVNDWTELSAYLSVMKSLGDSLRSRLANVYFMTVNPIDKKKAKKYGYTTTITNQKIADFNNAMIKGLSGYGMVNTYDYLTGNGYKTSDGIHYTASTYRAIYSFLCSRLLTSTGS